MNKMKSAFPHRESIHANPDSLDHSGMTLRDYFAAKAPMPNAAEASTILGWKCRETVPYPRMKMGQRDATFEEQVKAWQELLTFAELWMGLTNEERFACCAKSQYQYADAMLAERTKDGAQ